jgi:CHAD domain-containing protein
MSEPAEYQPEQRSRSKAVSQMMQHLAEVAAAMRERLDACREERDDPKVESVHHLRTGTRRVEATLETLAREVGTGGLGEAAEEARRRWLRQLQKVRRAAGAVRDLDVHRELLAENFLPPSDTAPDKVAAELADATTTAAGSDAITPLMKQARILDAWLKNRRTTSADALSETLDDHAERLLRAEQQFQTAIAQRRPVASRAQRRPVTSRAHRTSARLALEDYLRLVDAMPLLDRENLHDFRKGAKKARYIAESDENDPAAKAIAKTIQRVQDAIGKWHDWEVVAGEAGEALGRDGDALRVELEERAQRAYERALRAVATINRRLVGEWRAASPRKRIRSRQSR